jgi:predicted nucleic acid-binding protein
MTVAVVIDASVALARIRREPLWQDIDRMIRVWRAEGAILYVPTHFWLEISNALVRGHRMPGAAVLEAIHRLDELGLETVDMNRPLLLLALDLAERHGLTMYDACYLAIAESLRSLLFSADRELVAAAGSRGLSPSGLSDHRLSQTPGEYGVERRSTWPDYSGASAYLAKLRSEVSRPA